MQRLLCSLVLLASACAARGGRAGAAPEAGFVGQVAGSEAFIAIVTGETEAAAYVCNGEEQIFEWFEGALDAPGAIQLSNAAGGELSATRLGDGFEGEVTLSAGTRHSFTSEVADSAAGLFRVLGAEAEADGIKAGWIVDNDGDERGALLRSGSFEPAPALPSEGLRLNGVTYSVFKIALGPRTPSPPAGPIPIPYPNTGTTATR
ncbi:MAG: DUF4150 domain-containing protein [Myxococcales bacterium]|nr:DUF4150 domain-containing protein [Myxococcales bacterium]